MHTLIIAAAKPAGGAATSDIVFATAGAIAATVTLLVVGLLQRSGRMPLLPKLAALTEKESGGLPGWSSLPGLVALGALAIAVTGMYWDISLHIDNGRDPGPLANPAHYLILIGLFGVFAAGFLSMVLSRERPGASAARLASGWYAPIGGLLLFACGAFSLLGFPLDDVWHRLFGQDVTLWGPTHLMLFGGAALTLIGRSALMVEGERVARARNTLTARGERFLNFERASLCGAFLVGLSTFQGEFDFGVPQFKMIWQPILIVLAASMALVAARIWAGRWGAVMAAIQFCVIRGLVAIFVAPVAGQITPHFPLYLVEAVLVELAAFALLRSGRLRPLTLGVVSGALIGTVGMAAEWGWSNIWMPLPWPSSLLPEVIPLCLITGLAGGAIGALIGAALNSDRITLPKRSGWVLAAGLTAIVAVTAVGLYHTNEKGVTVRAALTTLKPGPHRTVAARITLTPRSAADNAEWVTVTAWQGHAHLIVDRLHKVRQGVYTTNQPIPAFGEWKSTFRLQKDNAIMATPIYMPGDPAIPAPLVPAKAHIARPLVPDKKILQRESKPQNRGLEPIAYLIVLVCFAVLFALLTWGMRRLAHAGAAYGPPPPEPKPERAKARPRTPVAA